MKKKQAKCKCVERVNEQLAESGVKIKQHIQIDFSTGKSGMSPPVVQLEKTESKKRRREPVLICVHCPFCGRKFE